MSKSESSPATPRGDPIAWAVLDEGSGELVDVALLRPEEPEPGVRFEPLIYASSETTPPITENDKRWRILEHGCQWVSFTPIGGETHSFDPRDLAGLKAMRAFADETLKKQLAFIDEEITRRRSSTKESRNV